MGTLSRAGESIRTMWAGLSASHRAVVVILVLALAAVVAWGASAAGSTGESQLVGPDTSTDVQADVLAKLDAMGVHYRVSNGAIYVPADMADELRIKVQGGGSGGVEDQPGLFDTRWQSEKRELTALQSKLGLMISRLDGVRSAIVQLVPPKESGFRAERSDGSASVMVEMKVGAAVTRSLVNAIVQIVSGGSGVKPGNVKVISGSRVHGVGDDAEMGDTGFHDQEIALGKQIAQMVEKLLPIEARVMAAVRLSAKRVEEQSTTANEPAKKSEDGSRIEYLVPTKEVKSLTPFGADITELSVAVVIPEKPPVPTEDDARAVFIKKIVSIVYKATGAPEGSVTVETVPVAAAPAPVAAVPTAQEELWETVRQNAGQILLVILALVIGFALWRMARASVRSAPAVTVEDGPDLEAAPVGAEGTLKASVSEAALREPREAAEVVRRMMER